MREGEGGCGEAVEELLTRLIYDAIVLYLICGIIYVSFSEDHEYCIVAASTL